MNYRLCYVCTGNACRSPLAECVTKAFLRREGVNDVEVFSVGTLDWGENPRDADMVRVAGELGYDLAGKTTYMTREALQAADVIVVFDGGHRNEITRILDYDHWNRIVLFDQLAFGQNTNVMDPHYQTMAVYRHVAEHIEEGCKLIVAKLKEKEPLL